MPTPRQMRKFVNQIVSQKIEEYPTTATIAEVNGNTCDVRLPGRSTHHKNCHVIGDPNSLFAGLHVNLLWDNYNGTKRPIVLAPGGGGVSGENRMVISTTSGSSTDVDDVTIENSPQGIRVKIGSITQEHLSFIPALIDHEHAVGEIIPGWNVTDDGILYSSQVSINPLGTITWGRDPDIVKIGIEDSTYRIWAGNSIPDNAPFSVSKTGHLTSSSATIAGWAISTTQIKKTGIILDSAADAIYVGASNQIILDGGDATMYLGYGDPQIVLDGNVKIIKSSNFSSGETGFGIYATDGDAEFNNVTVRGTIRASIFNIGEISATAGTAGIWKSAAETYADETFPATGSQGNFTVKNSDATPSIAPFSQRDVLRIKAWNGSSIVDVWLTITSITASTGYSTVSYIVESGGGSTVYKGTAVIDWGPSAGGGHVIMSADNTYGYAANLSISSMRSGVVSAVSVGSNDGSGYVTGDTVKINAQHGSGSGLECLLRVTASGGNVTGLTIIEDSNGLTGGAVYLEATDEATTTVTGVGSGLLVDIDTITGPWAAENTLQARFGNMRGSYGAGANERYGFGVGDYSTGNYISYNAEAEDSLVFKSGDGQVTLNESGIQIGAGVGVNNSIIWDDGSQNVFRVQGNDVPASYYIGSMVAYAYNNATPGRVVLQGESNLATADVRLIVEGRSSGRTPGDTYGQVVANFENASGHFAIANDADLYTPTPSAKIVAGSGDISTSGGIYVGSASSNPDAGDVHYTSDLRPRRNSTNYTVYGIFMHPAPDVIWNAVARSSATGTLTEAQLSNVYTVPENAKMVYIRIAARDSGTFPQDLYLAVGPTTSAFDLACYPHGNSGGTELFDGESGWVNITSGTIGWKTVASGASTMDTWLWVLGYSI